MRGFERVDGDIGRCDGCGGVVVVVVVVVENTPFAPNFYSADANLQNLFFALQYPGKF